MDGLGIGRRLKEARNHLGLSQQALAEKIGSSKTGIQANEGGKSVPGGALIIGLMDLGISANWLLANKGPMLLTGFDSPPTAVNGEVLGQALAAVESIAAERRLKLSPEKRGKLGALVYQYFLIEKAETEAAAYVVQLMELVSNH